MTTHSKENLAFLSKKIGYKFKDINLLTLALTHRSYGSENNERLEFLGDSILNFVIGEALMERLPKAHEGQLTRLRAKLVCGATLEKVGKELDLAGFVRLGKGEASSGIRSSILSDCVEGIIGAIYLDSNILTAKNCVLSWYSTRLDKIDIDDDNKDPKSALQEFLQAKGEGLPSYELARTLGDERDGTLEFEVSCTVNLINEPVFGVGTSKRKAEQAAACKMLEKLKSGR